MREVVRTVLRRPIGKDAHVNTYVLGMQIGGIWEDIGKRDLNRVKRISESAKESVTKLRDDKVLTVEQAKEYIELFDAIVEDAEKGRWADAGKKLDEIRRTYWEHLYLFRMYRQLFPKLI